MHLTCQLQGNFNNLIVPKAYFGVAIQSIEFCTQFYDAFMPPMPYLSSYSTFNRLAEIQNRGIYIYKSTGYISEVIFNLHCIQSIQSNPKTTWETNKTINYRVNDLLITYSRYTTFNRLGIVP